MMFKRLVRKIKQLICILVVFITTNKSIFLRILKYEVENYLEDCCNAGTKEIEELQNLLFHINSYLEVPDALQETMFVDFKGTNSEARALFIRYLEEIERQRAVERLYIMESLKHFPFDPII